MYIIKKWLGANKNNVYIFHGNEDVDKIESESLYKDNFTNKVVFVPESIFISDTLLSVKRKIAQFCSKNIDVDSIYMWGLIDTNEDEMKSFWLDVFKSNKTLSVEYLSNILSIFYDATLLDKPLPVEGDLSLLEVLDIVKDFSQLNKPIGFKYTDINDHDVLLSPNPFGSHLSDVNLEENSLHSDMNVILYMTGINNTINYCAKKKDTKPVYFPFTKTTMNIDYFRVKDEFMTQYESSIVSDIDSWNHKTDLLMFRALPYKHDLNINLKHIFNRVHTNINMPLLIIKDNKTSMYKANKTSLSKVDKNTLKKIKNSESSLNNNPTRNSSYLLAYFHTGNVSFVLIMSKNGSYKVKFIMSGATYMSVEDITKELGCVESFIRDIGDENIYALGPLTDIFASPFIQISDYSTHNVLSMKNESIDYDQCLSNLKNLGFMFDVVGVDSNIIRLKFKEVSNFFNTDSVSSYIYKHREINDAELVSNIQAEFNLSKTEAENELSEKRNSMSIKVSKKGSNMFAVRDYDTSILVKLNIMSGSSFRIVTTNSQNSKYIKQLSLYIAHILTKKVVIKNKYVQPVETNSVKTKSAPNEPGFEDLLDNFDNDFDLSAFDDTGLFATESPVVNRETDMNLDDEVGNEEVEDTKQQSVIKTGVSKQDYTTHVLKRLQLADPLLFKWESDEGSKKTTNYSGKCGAVNYRQPIVLNKKEKEHIDKEHPGSYTGYVKTGSSKQLVEDNYYICPKIWCRVSNVSLTQDEFEKKYNSKCPTGEEPLVFPKKGTERSKNYFINRKGEEIHWPILMGRNKHPNNLQLPCCGKLVPKNETGTKDDQSMYISKIANTTTLEVGKNGVLPELLDNLLNKGISCVGIMDKKKSCYVRTGIEKENQLMYIMQIVLGVSDVKKYICDELTLSEYIFLNNGNTLRSYIDDSEISSIYKPIEFEIFRKSLIENKKYVKEHNLKHIVRRVKSLSVFDVDKTDEQFMTILRQYMIFRSFSNYKKSLVSDLFENDIDDMYHLIKNILKKENKNLIVLEFDETDVFLLNNKYFDVFESLDIEKDTCVIIKVGKSYEYVRLLTHKNTRPFVNATDIEPLITIFRKTKTPETKQEESKYDTGIKRIVLGMDFKIVGLVTLDDNFVPFDTYSTTNYARISVKSFVFVDEINIDNIDLAFARKIGVLKPKRLMKSLIVSKTPDTNLRVFTHSNVQTETDESDETKAFALSTRIQSKKKMLASYNVLVHELGHFTNSEKLVLLKSLLNKNKITYDDDDDVMNILLATHIGIFQTYYKNNTMNISPDEIIFTPKDVQLGALDALHDNVFSGLMVKKVSSDDNVIYIDKINIDALFPSP